MPTNLSALRQQLARLMGETVLATPAASPERLTTSEFGVAALAVYEDNYFLDWQGRFYQGTHKDTNFVVTDSKKANGKLTIGPAVAAVVDTTDRAELYQDFTATELNDAINLAISMVQDVALEDGEPAYLTVAKDTYEYPVPAGFVYIEAIYQESSTGGRYRATQDRVDARGWNILRGASPRIWFDSAYLTLTENRRLRIIGQKQPSELTLDTDTTEISKVYLIYQAKALLHQSRIRGRGADFEEHEEQMRTAQGLADRERLRLAVPGRGWKVGF